MKKIHPLDIKLAYLNGYLEDEVYVEQPKCFVVKNHEYKILRLKKYLYGLKKAPECGILTFTSTFKIWFTFFLYEYSLYKKFLTNEDICFYVFMLMILFWHATNQFCLKLSEKLCTWSFEMTNIGLMPYYLGLEVKQMKKDIFIS